jgi:hypothetical protein
MSRRIYMPRKPGMAMWLARLKRQRITLFAALTIPLALMLTIPVSASASVAKPDLKTSMGYSKMFKFVSKPLALCSYFKVSGTITYTESVSGGPHGASFNYTGITVRNPVLQSYVTPLIKGKCSGKKNVTRMVMGQAWTGYSCSFNPSISVSAPWGISLSFWPSCQNREQASYTTSYPTQHSFMQSNSGFNFGYGNYSSASHDVPPCYGVRVTGVLTIKNRSDSYQSGANSVCLKSLHI